jgi:formylglycine-generating enzyme required for sulfatase activity
MIHVAGGTFQMGDTFGEGDSDEKPVHGVTLDGYHLGQAEVTQALWQAVIGSNPSSFKNCDQCPVENVSWDDIVNDFLPRLNRLTGKTYRLPSEAEWEYAARGRGQKVRFGNGKDILQPSEANFDARKDYKQPYSEVGEYRGKTIPVKSFAANALGLYDMAGNVWEWCADDWHGDYKNAPADGRAWVDSPRGTDRVFRGGSWISYPLFARAASRNDYSPANENDNLGFRVAAVSL